VFQVGLEELCQDGQGAVHGELFEGIQGAVVQVRVGKFAWKRN
jgi:hypothetical protein